jgi:SAM-dependent methyltransferase
MRGSSFVLRVVGFVARHPSLSRILFNRVFKTGKVPQTHNSLLEEAVRTIRPGKALDVTVGQGRNAVFLALRGWDVTGFDTSEEALSRAGEAARRSGVSIHAVQSTSEAFDYGADRWDLLLLSYAWAPVSDPAFAARLKQSLRNGGLVVFEHFLHDGPDAAPKAAGAPDPGELPKLFAGFEILCYEELKGVPDWKEALGGGALPRLVRMIARKPAGDQ